jgi:hypothetical protein
MTIPTDLRRCSAWYKLNSAGYNIGGQYLVDYSGKGNHLPLVFGSGPVFATYDSIPAMNLDNSYYFEGLTPVPIMGSVMFKMHLTASGLDGTLIPIWQRTSTYGPDDHTASTIIGAWTTSDRRNVTYLNAVPAMNAGDYGGGPAAQCTIPPIASPVWAVYTFAWNTFDKIARAKRDSLTTVTSAVFGSVVQSADDILRIGYASGAVVGPTRHLAISEMAFFHDDILQNQASDAAGLIASWS